jgi:DNA polymerase III delta subunit
MDPQEKDFLGNPSTPPWYPIPTSRATSILIVLPLTKKVLPYPIYVLGFELNAHIQMLRKAITIDGEHNKMDIVNLLCFSFHDDIYKWAKNFKQNHSNCAFDKLEVFFGKNIKRFKLMNKCI